MNREEARAAGLKRYDPLKTCTHGHVADRYVGNNECVICSSKRSLKYAVDHKDEAKIRAAKMRLEKPHKIKAFSRAYYLSNSKKIKANVKQWANDNPDRVKENAQRTYKLNPERTKAQAKAWSKANPGKVRATLARNRKRRKLAKIPLSEANEAWLVQIYAQCPPSCQVDHIYPINGKNTCGLHVPWNLQYLTPAANREKSNKLPEGGTGMAFGQCQREAA
jgi:hypothetical protein